jgi:excisionase family DNA binding protein
MADESDVPEVMDIHRASQYLRVSRETLYKYLNEERIPAFKLGNRWRLKKTVLDRWMESESTRREGALRGQRRENPALGSK